LVPVPVIPIIGARRLTQLEDNIASLELSPSDEQLGRLNRLSAAPLGFPMELFKKAGEKCEPVVS
jgi:aryl-alcohol dehydrogenase-like predicted oxidoreductase